jgi:hypothetical protein
MNNFDNLKFRNIQKIDFARIERDYLKQNIDFESYKNQKIKELNGFTSNKIKIYLDLKYLIKIRESLTEKDTSVNKRIFFRLKELVNNGKVICPFSESILDEILKQSPERRIKTAEVLDILSKNISFKPLIYIFIREFRNVLNFYSGMNQEKINYWDYPISLLGYLDFEISDTNEIDINFTKILFYEGMITETIQEIISRHKKVECTAISSIAEKIINSTPYDSKANSIETIIYNELKSCFISIGEELKMPQFVIEQLQDFKSKDIEKIAPSIFVFCSLHAELIKDSSKKYKRNDYYDILHSCLAIPNCDYFFTEDSFMYRTKNVLKMDKKYKVHIESKPQHILSLLENI